MYDSESSSPIICLFAPQVGEASARMSAAVAAQQQALAGELHYSTNSTVSALRWGWFFIYRRHRDGRDSLLAAFWLLFWGPTAFDSRSWTNN